MNKNSIETQTTSSNSFLVGELPSLAKSDDTLAQLKYITRYRQDLAVSSQGSLNPYNKFGLMHNKIMDIMSTRIGEFLVLDNHQINEKKTESKLIALVEEVIVCEQFDVPKQTYCDKPPISFFELSRLEPHEVLKLAQVTGLVSGLTRQVATQYFEAVGQYRGSMREFAQMTIDFDTAVLSSRTLPTADIHAILEFTAIALNSGIYWNAEFADPLSNWNESSSKSLSELNMISIRPNASRSRRKWKRILGCDAVGAIWFGFAGAVLGSLSCMIGSLE